MAATIAIDTIKKLSRARVNIVSEYYSTSSKTLKIVSLINYGIKFFSKNVRKVRASPIRCHYSCVRKPVIKNK